MYSKQYLRDVSIYIRREYKILSRTYFVYYSSDTYVAVFIYIRSAQDIPSQCIPIYVVHVARRIK